MVLRSALGALISHRHALALALGKNAPVALD
jgi:hypothetical protein